MALDTHIAADRAAVYQQLRRRNRLVLVLRVLVPLVGVMVLAVLGVQLAITNLAKDFTIGHVSVSRDRLMVDAPSYAGQLNDGSFYKVGAEKAQAALAAASIIDLEGASVTLSRASGVTYTASAPTAQLDTDNQTLDAPGTTTASDSTGGAGTVEGLHLDFPSQIFTSSGPVHFALASGDTLDAKTMRYDGNAKVWQFTGVSMSLTGTPGEALPEPVGLALHGMPGGGLPIGGTP